jgi:hypothetical protein
MTYVVIAEAGPPCPRCHRPMQVREHRIIGSKQLRKRYYYRRWFRCMNVNCRTTIVHDDQFRVFNDPEEARMQAILEQLRPRE